MFTTWFIVTGALLISMALAGSALRRAPLTASMFYLAVGAALGPWGVGLLHVNAVEDASIVERLTEIAVIISLFTAGLKLRLPASDQRWRAPIFLAALAMVLTIAGIAAFAVAAHEFGVFVRSAAQIDRARAAVQKSKMPFRILDERVETATGQVSICTMHLAKGLEFRAVVVMACDDEVIPLQERIETVGDEADLKEVYDTERHLLYVACTRARDHLLVTSVEPRSEFLDDMNK